MWVVKAESSPDTQGQTAGRESYYRDLSLSKPFLVLLVDIIKCSEGVEMGIKTLWVRI